MPLTRSVRAIPEPPIAKGLPKPVLDALAERARVRDLLNSARKDHGEVTNYHRLAVEADRNAAADVRLRQAGDVGEPAAPALAQRIKELDEELDVLNLAANKAEDALSEALVANVEKVHAVGVAAIVKALTEEKKRLEAALEGLVDVHAAIGLISYACDVEGGIVPRGLKANMATYLEQRNGQNLTIKDALIASLGTVNKALDSWQG
jgi:hypothetical protein